MEKFQISVKNLNNLRSFIEISAVFVLNLCGEKLVRRKSLWRKNDKYEVCGFDASLGVMLSFEFTICRTQTSAQLALTTVVRLVLDTCAGTSRYNNHAGDRKKILENENCSGILPLREETVQRG